MTDEGEAGAGAKHGAGGASVKPMLAWGGGVALWGFLALLAFQSGYFWRYVAWTDFQVFQPKPDSGGEFVDQGEGRLGLSPKIGPMIEQRLSPREAKELAALRDEARGLWGAEKETADKWLARVSSVKVLNAAPPFEVRVQVAMKDQKRAVRLAWMVGDEILQYAARMRMDEQLAKAEPLIREVDALGEKAPPELLARLREATMGPGMMLATIRRMGSQYAAVSVKRELVWRRFADACVPAGLGAMLAGVATGAVVKRVRGRRAG